MRERQDFYGLLHVQRDAPPAVIRASYRAMMQKLRHHPDLGGDEVIAKRLNEAMATLGDPSSRARYDATLDAPEASPGTRRETPPEPAERAAEPNGTTSGATASRSAHPASVLALGTRRGLPSASPRAYCPFCRAPRWSGLPSASGYAEEIAARCDRCGGPTRAVVPPPGGVARAASGGALAAERRRLHRSAFSDAVRFWRRWPLERADTADMADLSSSGCALETTVELRPGEVLLLASRTLDAIGEVRSCRPEGDGQRYRVGLAFLTTRVHTAPGALYSSTV